MGGRHALSAAEMAARDVDVQMLLRRGRTEAELRESLRSMLSGLDLRRAGRVDVQMLRAALASGGPPRQLSPLHTQLLSDLADSQAQLPTSGGSGSRALGLLASGPLGEVLLGLEVAVQPYIASAVQSVAEAQGRLFSVVYGERGMSAMLRQLYRQGAGADDPLELLTRGPRVVPTAAEEALHTLLEVQGLKASSLLRAALLPHQQLESPPDVGDAAAGGGAPVTPVALHSARRYPQSWASATAHLLHAYTALASSGF
ncbi:hypothetical protein GPECTOR_16g572 [Gonium pectorale]|uniref:Uncharacterized protein n=1 Tax=Gonium pectorale TaxID=33097 RepID=A0A150GKM2_GONPE|nr:hypothetical protein GPECTOR_16g572 [Gonium pectorale]|eukprot:KXZ50399.1 hypothetical protein GPECTOR_16g572 [Gonium pectorale]